MQRKDILKKRLSILQRFYFNRNAAKVSINSIVLGPLPIIVNPFKSILEIQEYTTMNSDNKSLFVPVSSPVKFALGENAKIVVGKHCDLNACTITAYSEVKIGDYVQVGPATWITDSDLHAIDPSTRRKQLLGKEYEKNEIQRYKVTIESDVWIGAFVKILKGVTIGEGSVIGAGSVVYRSVPPFSIVMGNPAKIVRKFEA